MATFSATARGSVPRPVRCVALNGEPHVGRRQRHVRVCHAERGERVHDRVDHGGGGGGGGGGARGPSCGGGAGGGGGGGGERAHARVAHGGRRADGGGLADAFGADGMMGGRGDRHAEFRRGALKRRGQQVVHEGTAQAVADLVERDGLHQRDADAVGQAAVHLSLDDHRVDPDPAV